MSKSLLFKRNVFVKKILITIIILGVCWLHLSCTKNDATPLAQDIVKLLSLKDKSSQITKDIKKEIQIYIDASTSMSGYVNRQGNTTFGKVLRSLRSSHLSGYKVSFFKFGVDEPQRMDLNAFWDMSSNRSLYNQTSTRLDLTMSSCLNNRESASAYLVITDGVQASLRGSDYPAFIDPINRWLEQEHHILHIYAFRGEFDGSIYPETGGSPFYYRSIPDNQLTFRPFYIFAFILDQRLEERISDIVRGFGVSYKVLNLGDKILNKSNIEFDTQLPAEQSPESSFRKFLKAEEEKGITIQHLVWRSKKSGLEHGKLKVKFRLDLTDFGREILQKSDNIRADVKIVRLLRKVSITKNQKNEEVRYSTWTGSSIQNMDGYLPKLEKSQLIRGAEAGNFTNSIIMDFPRIPESGWYSYHVNILPNRDAFQISSWVRDWSTDRDDLATNANKTLNLEKVVSSIFYNAPIKDRCLAEFCLIIKF